MPKRKIQTVNMDILVSLCKRRGFVFQGSEIYGGIASVWDYGPAGAEIKRNVKDVWWSAMVKERDEIVGIDSAILMHPDVWAASGHLDNFTDPLSECAECHRRFKADDTPEGICAHCGGRLGEPRSFNLMFKTHIGPLEGSGNEIYLRPETAQGIFVNFDNIRTVTRRRIPFGIAQIGKSFRNEITPGNFTFRTREFEQMEMEFFCEPGTDDEWYRYWVDFSLDWFKRFGIRGENLRVRKHSQEELPHYSKASADIEYRFPWGWGEIETISSRTDYDLKAHMEHSRKDLSYYDDTAKRRFVPFVVEPAMGADRSILAFMTDAYDEDEAEGKTRVVLRFHPDIAPSQIAVLPLSRNDQLTDKARSIYDFLRPLFNCQYDDAQSIGRRYRRQDEIGTPLCITVDFATVEEDDAVTIRDRDTMKQVRTSISNLIQTINDELNRMRLECHG